MIYYLITNIIRLIYVVEKLQFIDRINYLRNTCCIRSFQRNIKIFIKTTCRRYVKAVLIASNVNKIPKRNVMFAYYVIHTMYIIY